MKKIVKNGIAFTMLQPELTDFQVSILMGMVDTARNKLKDELKTPDGQRNVASIVASMVEYDEMYAALEAEHKQYTDRRSRS